MMQSLGVKRLFIDGLEPIQESMIYEDRIKRFLVALTNRLRALDVTTCFASDLPDLFSDRITTPIETLAVLIDNVIFLRYVELHSQLYRLISIMKMRDSTYDSAIREFKIGTQGIAVASTFRSAEAILTGVARPLPTVSRSQSQIPGQAAESQDWDQMQP
jgi:circadian clock protein KaiC